MERGPEILNNNLNYSSMNMNMNNDIQNRPSVYEQSDFELPRPKHN